MYNPNIEYLRKAYHESKNKPKATIEDVKEPVRLYGFDELRPQDRTPIKYHHNEITDINLAGLNLPLSSFEENVYFDGSPGSGKTKLLHCLLQSVLKTIKKVPGVLILNDYKGDLYGKLKFYCEQNNIAFYYFNPTAKNTDIWDVAADIGDDYYKAREILSVLIPKTDEKNGSFWRSSAIALAEGSLKVFMDKYPGKWGFHDLFNACMIGERELNKFITNSPSNEYLKNMFLKNSAGETFGNIQATLYSALNSIKLLANLQYYAQTEKEVRPRLVSLTHILKTGGVMVIGQDNTKMYSARPCIQAMFKVIGDYLLAKPNVDFAPNHFHTWIAWDELPEYGYLHNLVDLLNKGREKRVSLFLVAQHFAQLEAIYDKKAAEFLQCCTVKFLMRSQDMKNAKWKSEQVGETEIAKKSMSHSDSSGLNSSYAGQRIPCFRPEWFMGIPPFKPGTPLNFAMMTPYSGALQRFLENELVMKLQFKNPSKGYQAIPFKAIDFAPWNPNDTPLMGYRTLKEKYLNDHTGISKDKQKLNTRIREEIIKSQMNSLSLSSGGSL